MTPSATSQRSKLLFGILVVVVSAGLVWSAICTIDLVLHPLAPSPFFDSTIVRLAIGLVIAPLTVGVALLVVRREPGNVVGLLLMLIGEAYIASTLRTDNGSPLAAILSSTYGGMEWPGLFLLILYFPVGKIFFRSIARLVNAMACFFLLMFISAPLSNQEFTLGPPIEGLGQVTYSNPLYLPWFARISNALLPIGQAMVFILMGFGLVSLIFRYRAGNERERLQIRWLAWCFGVFVVLALTGFAFNLFSLSLSSPVPLIYNLIFYAWLYVFPAISVGNAILRHRLYDIDIIIRRTLIYSVLTVILALVYFGGVVLTQVALRPVMGESSDAGIVISTLLIRALFAPLRRRVQNVIDRRFYRRKYNAEKMLAAFNATMRDEVDLDKLQAALVNVVQETMQPSKISLWIKNSKSEPANKGTK